MTSPDRTAESWIAAFAAELGVDPPTEETVEILLDLAGVAAHSSERIAAPIACYLVGIAGLDPTAGHRVAQRVAGS